MPSVQDDKSKSETGANMKKLLQLFFVVLVLITGCSSNQIGMDTLDLEHENNIEIGPSCNFTGKGNTFYYVSGYSDLYVVDTDFNMIDLGTLSYSDDKKVDEIKPNATLKRYIDSNLYDIYFYDSKLYYLSNRISVEGDISFQLNVLDERNETRKQLMNLDYYPSMFIIQKGYVVIIQSDEGTFLNTVHVYNQKLNEVKVIKADGYISRIFAEGDNVYLSGGAFDGEKGGTLILHLNDLSTDEIYPGEKETYVFFREDTYATRSINKSINEVGDPSEITYHSTIYDKKTNEVIFEVENELIGYYDDAYIYTTTLKNPNAKYRIYDFNHQLIKEINPSDSLPREAGLDVIFSTQDFDSIYRVFNNHIISGTTSPDKFEIVACSIDSGACKVIASEPYGISIEQ